MRALKGIFNYGKSDIELIEEIHENFYTEVDRLLAEAKISKSLDTSKQDLIDKAARLREFGFHNTKEAKEADEEESRLNKLKKENEVKRNLIDAINYFSVKYPQYKFITEESVKKICNKYGLVYGETDNYIGNVPEKNLKHIEDFKIEESDKCYEVRYNSEYSPFHYKYLDKAGMEEFKKSERERIFRSYTDYTFHKLSLEIAAPIKDFDTTNMEVKDFKLSKIEIPDPVVLKPVFFKGSKHYLIVTAWGDEASDELVVNEKMN